MALAGPHFDGRAFLSQAFERGAAGALISGPWSLDSTPDPRIIIEVDDTLQALGDLARFWREPFSLPLVGITGSNGKTTTKEMLAGILEPGGPTLKNPGNLNNLIGLPLTLLGLGPEHRFAVLEMGMNRSGEIRRLSAIAGPTVGLITNIGPAHLEGLGSLEAISRAKGELFEALTRKDWAVINQDDPTDSGIIHPLPQSKNHLRAGFPGRSPGRRSPPRLDPGSFFGSALRDNAGRSGCRSPAGIMSAMPWPPRPPP